MVEVLGNSAVVDNLVEVVDTPVEVGYNSSAPVGNLVEERDSLPLVASILVPGVGTLVAVVGTVLVVYMKAEVENNLSLAGYNLQFY